MRRYATGVTIAGDAKKMIVRLGEKSVAVPFDVEDECLVVDLDAIVHWDEPADAGEPGIADLQAIAAAIEAECDAQGLDVEFA